jgi:uncharacterized protein (DUF433 family)
MTIDVVHTYIVADPHTLGGKPRIAGHRISVQDVAIWHERMGMSADAIASAYDLTLSQVYAALAYYFDHQGVIDAAIRAGSQQVQVLREQQGQMPRG